MVGHDTALCTKYVMIDLNIIAYWIGYGAKDIPLKEIHFSFKALRLRRNWKWIFLLDLSTFENVAWTILYTRYLMVKVWLFKELNNGNWYELNAEDFTCHYTFLYFLFAISVPLLNVEFIMYSHHRIQYVIIS